MATLDDIDTKAAVRKFLERRTVVDREDESADSAEEVAAVLESVAQAFLLHPQAALSFVLKAKNTVQQILTTDIEFVDYLLKALRDIDAPSDPVSDLSDLIEAQTALVEVDRAGRVSDDLQSFGRYRLAIDRFLDEQLAKTLKRRRRGEFERTGREARQDLFRALLAFDPIHALMAEKLALLQVSVEDFQSVDLTKIVSTRAVARVRSSLKKVSSGLEKQSLSKTSAAIELLAGRDALRSISNARSIYDPTIETGDFPANRIIRVSSQLVAATALGTDEDVDLTGVATPWTFSLIADVLIAGGTSFDIDIPVTGAEGRHYVKAAEGAATYEIDVGENVLYVAFYGVAPPANEEVMVRAVALPTGGAVTLSAILSALNDGVTGLLDGTAVELGNGRILIYGDAGVTGITIRGSYPGTFDLGGSYVPADGSVHEVLGFTLDQSSGDPNVFSPAELVDLLKDRVVGLEVAVDDGAIRITSESTELLSSIQFDVDTIATLFGFDEIYVSEPEYLELVEDGVAVDPESLGVFVGSIVQASDISETSSRNILSPITSIEGTQLFFADTLPRCSEEVVKVDAPVVGELRTLLSRIGPYVGTFGDDSQDFQRVLTPVLARPTLAQVNDAVRVLTDVKDRLEELLALLQGVVVRDDRTSFGAVAAQIVASLQERGLDRSLELLQSGQFSVFFGVDSQSASASSRFMTAIETVGRNDYAQTTIEEDIPDLEPKAATPDDDVLPGEELSENEEPV
jgi:hypothetical protein